MVDPTIALTTAIDNAAKVANTPLFTTVIDKMTGFKISKWAAEWELRKKIMHDEYEKAKQNGIMGVQYISSLRAVTNLIDTAVKSSKYIDSNKTNEIEMDNDFFWNTIEHSKTISNDEMQELIAKILAGEYNNPWTYSMSTLHTIKMLGKSELELFSKVCSLLIEGDYILQELFSLPESAKQLLGELEIDFGSLQILQNLGLFLPNKMSISLSNPNKQNLVILYFDKPLVFTPENENFITTRTPQFYSLSITGKQILRYIKTEINVDYFNWLKLNYKIPNYKLIEEI